MKVKSIRTKIALLLACTSITMILVTQIVSYAVNKKNIVELCESYLYDTCISASDTLYESFYGDSERNDMSVRLEYILYNVGIDTMKSSKAYLVDSEGNYLYHPNDDMIGTKLQGNEVIENVLDRLGQGYITTADVTTCTVDGKEVYIAFMCTVNDWVIFVEADADDVLQPITTITTYTIVAGVAVFIVAIAVAYVIMAKLLKPISSLTKVINDISEFDMSRDYKIPKSKDEIGVMGNAVIKMKENLTTIVSELDNISEKLVADANVMYEISEQISSASTDNSATNEELAASMEETSASTESVNGNIKNMNGNVAAVADKIKEGSNLTTDVRGKTDVINKKTREASEATIKVYDSIKETSNEAIEKAKEIEKINGMVTAIQEIAEQTSLLSLNASIEAARAGEQGKGFAVVASEIGKLAAETNDTSAGISKIVVEVNNSVDTLTQCLKEMLNFLETKVMNDYSDFIDASEEYNVAAQSIEDFMGLANEEVVQLREGIEHITEMMEGISRNVGEASIGVMDIAEKTTNVVEQTAESFERTSNCKESAEKLREITSRFKL